MWACIKCWAALRLPEWLRVVVFVDLVIERRLDRRGQWTRSGTNAVRQGHNDEISALLVTRARAVHGRGPTPTVHRLESPIGLT